MLRVVVAFLLAGCWRADAPNTAPSPARTLTVDETTEPMPCVSFDARNPTCKTACPRDAPAGWASCDDQTRALLARGYACTSGMPWSCTPPPPKPPCPPATQCQPIHARVVAVQVTGNAIEVKIGAGSNQGVTLGWKATLADASWHPLPTGALAIVGVSAQLTTARMTATADQLRTTPNVLLEP